MSEMQTLARGVYWARHTKSGCKLAYAVDSKGDEVKRFRVTIPSRESAAVETLWDLLDVVDPPPPQLKLVEDDKPAPSTATPAPRRGWKEAYDPYDPPPLVFRRRFD